MVRQYDDILHKNWDIASEEQRERINFMKARTLKLSGVGSEVEDLDETDAMIYPKTTIWR